MLAQFVPQISPKAESCFFTDRAGFTTRPAPHETNPALLLFRPEPT